MQRIDCVQSDARAFVIAGDWKQMESEAGMWVKAVTESGRRFIASMKKKEEDAAGHCQDKKEASETRHNRVRPGNELNFKIGFNSL